MVSPSPVAPACLTSRRLERLRELFPHLDAARIAAPGGRADRELGPVCDALLHLSAEICARPTPGIIGLVEIAAVAQYWYRPPPLEGSAWSATDPASQIVSALIAATFALFDRADDAA